MLARQQGKTYFAGLEVYVWMADRRFEGDFGWGERIVGGHVDGEQPQSPRIGRGGIARTFEHSFPVEQIRVG